MRKKIILLALIAGMVILTTSFLIAKEIEKNKQQEKRIIKYKQKIVKPVNQKKPKDVQAKKEPKDFQDEPEQTGEINTNSWQTYRSEEYRFEVKYPNKWYWEDYTEEFGHSIISFYPNNAKKGFDYLGDIKIQKSEKNIEKNFVEYFKDTFRVMPYMYDKAIIRKNNYNRDIILIYDVPGYIISDTAFVDCGNYVISINTPFGIARNIMKQMANDISCW